jgi:hypothetical protein
MRVKSCMNDYSPLRHWDVGASGTIDTYWIFIGDFHDLDDRAAASMASNDGLGLWILIGVT